MDNCKRYNRVGKNITNHNKLNLKGINMKKLNNLFFLMFLPKRRKNNK